MGSYSQTRYRDIVARTVFNCEFHRGTWQDLSVSQRVMSPSGTPTWTKINGLPAMSCPAAGTQVRTPVIPSVIDSTSPFYCELLGRRNLSAVDYFLYQLSGGGWALRWDPSTLVLRTYTAASANAREVVTAAGSIPARTLFHAVGYLDPVGLSGRWWVNGIPNAAVFTNSGVPALCASTNLQVGCVVSASDTMMIARVWQGTPTNADVAALYGACRDLTGGEV